MTAVRMGLRLGRWGLVGFSLAAFVWILTQTIGFYQVVGHTLASRVAFGASIETLAAKFVVIVPPPIRPDTVGGYVEFRGFHEIAILFGVWALASAVGFARGDEERGVLDAVLAAGESRIGLVASRVAAFAIAIMVAAAAGGVAFVAGVASGHESVEPLKVVEACALLVGVGVACYGIALLVAQLAGPRTATAAAAVVLLALFLVNSLSREFDWLWTWRWLSPFRYYDLSQPLPPSGYFDLAAFVVLLIIAALTSTAAAFAFERRDAGAPLVVVPVRARPPVYDPVVAPFWGIAIVRGIFDQRLGFAVWAIGTAALAVLFVSLTRSVVQVLLAVPALAPYLSTFVRQQVYPSALGYIWFSFAELLFAAFAIVQVARWSGEDADGRLEMALSQPTSRAGVVVERMAVLIAGALLIAGVSGATLSYSSHASGIDLDASRLVAASLMLVPFGLVFAGAGALLAAWAPRAALGLLGAFTVATYLDTELGPIFKLPLWLQDLSPFKLFGTPLLTGIDGRDLALLLLLASVGVGSSILLMERRDVGA